MSSDDLIEELKTLNQIAETLNGAVDVRTVLNGALARLVDLMGLQAGWIFLKQPDAQEAWHGRGYVLIAHHNLPPAMVLDSVEAWGSGCDCQGLLNKGKLSKAYNEVRCSRLGAAHGDRHGLTVHASVPLRCCDDILGIMNVAAREWSEFSPKALALLGSAGAMMGIALQRAQLFDLLKEQRIQEQSALLDFSSQLLSHLELDGMACYVVEKVQQLVRADACALLLPDDEPGQLVYRAAIGWNTDPVAAQRRAPADFSSGPGRVLQTQQPIIVQDLAQDEGTVSIPEWLRAEGFHSHAIIPLIADTRSIGALLIDTRTPRTLGEDEVRFLRLIGNQAALALEKARLHEETLRQQRLEHELTVARRIQLSLLPKGVPNIPGWEFATVYQPAHEVGGDFYDFVRFQDGPANQLGIVIADVADKGMPAALFMASARTMIRSAASTGHDPSATLLCANDLILQDSRADTFITAFYAILDTQAGRLTYSNAGHNRPLWLHGTSGEIQELTTDGIVLGYFGNIALQERAASIQPGDILVFYTDGLTEAMNTQQEFFGVERLCQIVRDQRAASAPQLAQALQDGLHAFVGSTPQYDDVTMIVVRRCPDSRLL